MQPGALTRSDLEVRRDAALDALAEVAEAMADPDRPSDTATYERLIEEVETVCRLLVLLPDEERVAVG